MPQDATRILHLSDLHFDSKEKPGDEPLALPNDLATRIAVLCADEKFDFTPDCVVISGDFTEHGNRTEFGLARTFIQQLCTRLKIQKDDVIVVPGNHDVDWNGKTRAEAFQNYSTFFNWVRPQSIENDIDDLWFTCHWTNERLFVLGLNSCIIDGPTEKGIGYVDLKQWEDAQRLFEGKWKRSHARIAVVHHHLIPVERHIADPRFVEKNPSLTLNAQQVLEWLHKAGFQIVVHGHQHQPFFAVEKRFEFESVRDEDTVDPELVVVAAGSSGAKRDNLGDIQQRSFNLLSIDRACVQITPIHFMVGDDFKSYSPIVVPLRQPQRNRWLAKMISHLEIRRDELINNFNSVEIDGKRATLLRIQDHDVLSMAPSLYDLADNTVLATSFLPVDFWNTFLGEKILEVTTRNKTKDIRRLFVGEHLDPHLAGVMKKQEDMGVSPLFLSSRRYESLVRPVLGSFVNLLQHLGVDVSALERVHETPQLLAVAIYGKKVDEQFLGFDIEVEGKPFVGLVFNPPTRILNEVKTALNAAWADAIPSTRARKRTALLFGAHRWNRTSVIRDALESGLRVVLAKPISDGSEITSTLKSLVHGIEYISDNPITVDEESKEAERLKFNYGDNWCAIALDDYVAEMAAVLSSKSGDSCYPRSAAEIVKRKHLLREMWNQMEKENTIRGLHPVEYRYLEFENFEASVPHVTKSEGFDTISDTTRLVVKPDEMSASIEVHICQGKVQLEEGISSVRKALRNRWKGVGEAAGVEVRPRILIEAEIPRAVGGQWQPGAEFSAEYLSFRNHHQLIGVTQKWTGPHCIEAGHIFPASVHILQGDLIETLKSAIQALLTRLNVSYTLSHWEFIITPDLRIALVEGHLRPGGDSIMDLVELSTKVNPNRALLELLSGNSTAFVMRDHHRYAGIFWMAPKATLYRICEVNVPVDATDLCEDVHIKRDELLKEVNWSGPTDWTNRHAYLICTGTSAEEITKKCAMAASQITLTGRTANDQEAMTSLKLVIEQ